MTKPITPWTPIEIDEDTCSVRVWDRTYTVQRDVLFTSIVSRGNEILNAPIRLVGLENAEPIRWTEQTAFFVEEDAEYVTICGSQESTSFVVNTALRLEYDGCCHIDIKIVPRGKSVAEVFGLSQAKTNEYSLDRLWLEIPLKKEYAKLFHFWPYAPLSDDPVYDGKQTPHTDVSMSRKIPGSMTMPFKALLWFGTEQQGLCWFADSDENWEPEDPAKAIEVIDSEQEVLLRFHLIDSTAKAWQDTGVRPKNYAYPPISFRMGMQATPVKPFASNPYQEKILHIDCFKKIPEEYDTFLAKPVVDGTDEIGYDRMKRLGVTTLVLHEKWNKIQNDWNLSSPTRKLLKTIIGECHKRGIKVIPYFGYELSTLNPYYSDYAHCRVLEADGLYAGGWYRKPNQRAYHACCNSPYMADLADGIINLAEEFGFDGVYLDSCLSPAGCKNTAHGCGYTDSAGQTHLTYTVTATRTFIQKMYRYFQQKQGIVNVHLSNCCNIPALSFAHINWDGEYIQMHINKQGLHSVPLDYLRTEYTARHFGTTYEFLAYTFANWSFQDSLSLSLIHGMLSRPNDIGEPLEIMAPIWKAIDGFDMENARWCPYWENGLLPDSSNVKISYYQGNNGKYLIFVSNPTEYDRQRVQLSLPGVADALFSVTKQCYVSRELILDARESDVLLGG